MRVRKNGKQEFHLLVSKFEIIHLFLLSIPFSSLSAARDNAFAIMHGTVGAQ